MMLGINEPRFYTVQHGISTNAHYNAKTLLKKTTGDNPDLVLS